MKLFTLVFIIGLVEHVITHTDSCVNVNVNVGERSTKTDTQKHDFVGFSVARSTQMGPVPKTTLIPMDVELYNDGKYFHADNAFHAPVKGIYTFSFSGVSIHNDWVHLELYRQKVGSAKVGVANAHDYGSSGGSGAAGGTVMIKLEVGEMVSLWCENGESVRSAVGKLPSTLFSGKLEKRLD